MKDALETDRVAAANKEAAKQTSGSNLDQKGSFVGGVATARASDEKSRLFDLRQQQTQSGPYASTNSGNNIQNQVYPPPRDAQSYTGGVPASPPVTKARPDSNGALALSRLEQKEPSGTPNATPAEAVAKKKAPPEVVQEHGVVPAEDASKRKLETIPAPAPAPAKEETVAVAGQLQARERSYSSGAAGAAISTDEARKSPTTSVRKIDDRSAVNSISADAAPASATAPSGAITGWRVHRGRVQERLYGIWHTVAVNGENFKAAPGDVVSSDSNQAVIAQPRFIAVTALRTDIWAVQAIGKDQSNIVIHHSRDNGLTWQASTLVAGAIVNPTAQVSISFKDANHGELSLSTGERWQTTDGGTHWTSAK